MAADWYDEGYNIVIANAAAAAYITDHQAKMVYGTLVELGLIDYDVEKEVFHQLAHPELYD